MPRRRHGFQRAERAAVGEPHVDLAARAAEPSRGEPRANRRHRLGVVDVVMRQRDSAEAAAELDLRDHGLDVVVEQRPRVDHHAGSRPMIQVFVPDSENGLGLAARIPTSGYPGSSIRVIPVA